MHSRRSAFVTNQLLVRNVGKKCHLASSLDSYGELSLVKSAVAGNTSGETLSSLRGELSKLSDILVIDLGNLILAEDANLLSSMSLTICRTLIVFHKFKHLSDSRFLYYTNRSEPSGQRTICLLEGKALVSGNFLEISTTCAVKRRCAVCRRSITLTLRSLTGALGCCGCSEANFISYNLGNVPLLAIVVSPVSCLNATANNNAGALLKVT